MKRLLALMLCLCLLLCAAGCSAPNGSPDQGIDSPTSGTVAENNGIIESPTEPYHPSDIQQPMHAISMPIVKQHTYADDGSIVFTRTYQQIQLILHGTDVETAITEDLKIRIGYLLSGSADTENNALADYDGSEYWNPYFTDMLYTPTRLDQAVLSLFGNHSSYSGGVHPTSVSESVTYDLETGKALMLGDILVEGYPGESLSELIAASLADQAEELYHDYEEVLDDRFSGNYSGITSWYFSKTGLCFHFSPYDIAPYSAGTIIAEVPYENLAEVLKPQYLPAEPQEATGSMYAESYLEDDEERFSFIADVPLEEGGTKILLYPDATIADLRIEQGVRYADGSNYIATATVFAADSIGLGNAIAVTADFAQEETVLRLVYCSNGQEVSAFIVYDAEGDSVILSHG